MNALTQPLRRGALRGRSSARSALCPGVTWVWATLLICGTAGARAPDGPAWVASRPRSPEYITGIGVAARTGDPAAVREQATQNALRDIATQIEVQITSTAELTETEDVFGLGQAYSNRVRTVVQAELAAVEIVDTWEAPSAFWVYARLSTAALAARRQEQIERARRRGLDLFARAEELVPADVGAALALHLQGLAVVAEGLGDPLAVTWRGHAVELESAIPARIRDLLRALELQADPGPQVVKRGAHQDQPLAFRALFADTTGRSHPVPNLPVTAGFSTGAGRLIPPGPTGADGRSRVVIQQVTGAERLQVVRVRLDLDALTPPDGMDLGGRLSVPQVDLQLQVPAQLLHIAALESNLGDALPVLRVKPALAALLASKGCAFTDDAAQADVLLQLEVQTRAGNRFQNIHFAFLDLALSGRRADGTEFAVAGLSGVKGSGASFAAAGFKAYERALQDLEEKVVAELLAGL